MKETCNKLKETKMKIVGAICLLLLAGCMPEKGNQGIQGQPGVPGSVVQIPPTTTQLIVDQYNQTRNALGQESIIPGLTCSLYTVPTSTTQIAGASLSGVGSFLYQGAFNQPSSNVSAGLNVLPSALSQIYQTWFVLKCYGFLVSTDNAYHKFSLSSDDGSILYIDGASLNNDGIHSVTTKSYTRFLSEGVHSFELDFLQGAGLQTLILTMDGNQLPLDKLYH
jgi:hypothetical protein